MPINLRIGYLLLVCIIFTANMNILFNGYSLDDELVTGPENPTTQNLSDVKSIFTSWYDTQLGSNYEYRPIVKLVYAIENQLFGLNPGVHHFISLLFYTFCCILLFRFLAKLLDGNLLFSLAATILFAVHPMHTEVVASLKNRDILLVFIFAMLAANRLLAIFESKDFKLLKFLPVILLFYLAMLSKRDALSFVFIIPVLLWLKYSSAKLQAVSAAAIIAGCYILLLLTLKAILPDETSGRTMEFFENPIVSQRTIGNRIVALFNSAGFYILQNLFPVKQVSYYGYNAIPLLRPNGIYFFTGILSLGAGTFFFMRTLRKDLLLSYTLCFLLGGMILYLNVVRPVPGIAADRFAFVSSIGAAMLIVYIVQKIFRIDLKNYYTLKQIPSVSKIVFVSITLLFSVIVIRRNREWKDKETLFSADAQKKPESAKLHSLYALEMIRQYRELSSADPFTAKEKAAIAKSELRKSLEIYPDYINSMSNLGYLLLQLNENPQEALQLLEKAAKKKPDNGEILINYASALTRNGKYKAAEKVLIESLKLEKQMPGAYLQLMQNTEKTKNYSEVAENIAAHLPPEQKTEPMYTDIGNLFARGKDTLNAIRYYDSAVTVNPVNKNLGRYLFNHYKTRGMNDQAERIQRLFAGR
jgi:protein O-mannosyl-transferase